MPPQIPSCPSTSHLTPSDTLPPPFIYKINICCLRDFLPRPTIRRLEHDDLWRKTEIQWPAGSYYRTSRISFSDEGVAFVARGRKYIFVEALLSPADPFMRPLEDTSDIHSTNNIQQETSAEIPPIEYDHTATDTRHTTKQLRSHPFSPYLYDDYIQYEPYDFELQADSPLPKQPFQSGLYELHPILNIHTLFVDEIPNSSSSFILCLQPDADFGQDPLAIESPEHAQISLIDTSLPPTIISSSETFSSSSFPSLPLPPLSPTTPCKCHLIRHRTLLHQHLLSKALIQRFRYEIQTHSTSWTYEEKVQRCKSVVKRLVDVSSSVGISGTNIDTTGAVPIAAGATMAAVGNGDDGDGDGAVRGLLPPIPATITGLLTIHQQRLAAPPEHFPSVTVAPSLNAAQTRFLRRNSLGSTSDSSGSATSRRGTDLFGTLVGEIVGGEMVGWLEELLKILDEPVENNDDGEIDWRGKKARTGFTRWFGSVIEDNESECEEEEEHEQEEEGEVDEEGERDGEGKEREEGNVGSVNLGFHNGEMNEIQIRGERYTVNYYYPDDEWAEEGYPYPSLWVEEGNDVFDNVDITEEEDEEVNSRWESICAGGSSPPSGGFSRAFANRVQRCGRDVGGVRMRSESDTSVAA